MPWAKRTSRNLPGIKSPTTPYDFVDYSRGMNSYTGDDTFPIYEKSNYVRLAQNARVNTAGEYETRKGFDFHSDAAGETQDDTQTSTTGAADKSFSTTTWLAQEFTAGASQRLSKVELRLKNDASATGTVIVELWSDSSGPGDMLARTSISASDITGSYAYVTARFPDAPSITSATDYWIVAYIQSGGTGSYKWSSTTTATDAQASSDSGVTWASTSYALNFKQHYATSGAVKGFIRAYKSDGTAVSIFAHGTVLYSVNNSTGALTSLKTGLDSSATQYRFCVINDIVYYVNGFDGLRKLSGASFGTESQVSSTDYTILCEHKGLLFLVSKDDPNKVVFSNFADYETFTSTDFVYVPSPKVGDPVTALVSLNGYLLIFTRNNKYILSGEDNATFRLDEAPDQKGTFTQETVTADKNYAYYLSDDGVYRTNGTSAELMSESIYEEILSLSNKEDCVINVTAGRLRLWHPSSGSSFNDQCFVWNLNLTDGSKDMVESFDTEAFVNKAFTAFNDDNKLMVASSLIGQVYWQELSSNDYTNLGGDLEFIIQTHYNPFGTPAVIKQIRFWKPRFGAQSGSYNITCQYAYDQRNNWQTATSGTVSVQGSGSVWGSATWGSFTWGTTSEVQASLYVPGGYRRIALRYVHSATRQPQKFLGHTLIVQTRKIR